jgi:hypothetical protein
MMFLPPQQSWMSFTQSVWCSMLCNMGLHWITAQQEINLNKYINRTEDSKIQISRTFNMLKLFISIIRTEDKLNRFHLRRPSTVPTVYCIQYSHQVYRYYVER